jgi:DNA-binding protein H-NS
MVPNKSSLANLSNEELCKLRDEIAGLLESRAEALRKELDRLTGGETLNGGADRVSKARRRKARPKYRGPNGETWAGRGARPRWLSDAIGGGKKLEDFLIEQCAEN